MKIAVLGAKGFVGSSIAGHLLHNHHVTPVSRDTMDLLDPKQVVDFLRTNEFDVIINAAAVMNQPDTFYDTRNNLGIFMNFFNNAKFIKKFINLGSGAEFDRSRDINCASEMEIFDVLPQDSYAFGQNMKSRMCYNRYNFYTLRIFNCFGNGEIPTRIFPRILKNSSIEITNDRYFDYFSIQDFLKVVDHFVDTDPVFKDVNCVYQEKYKISQVAEKFCKLNNVKSEYIVLSESNNNYTGSGEKLAALEIPLDGLEKGLSEYVHS